MTDQREPAKRRDKRRFNGHPDFNATLKEELKATCELDEPCGTVLAAELCNRIESAMSSATEKCKSNQAAKKKRRTDLPLQIRQLLDERRAARKGGEGHRPLKCISKDLKKELRSWERHRKQEKIDGILREFSDIGRIHNIGNNFKKQRLTCVKNSEGAEVSDRQGIADVFATFYENLYSRKHCPGEAGITSSSSGEQSDIPPVTAEEVRTQVKKLKKGKAADSAGIVAEMFKDGGDYLLEVLAHVFTSILADGEEPPQTWRHTCIKVLFKKGDTKLPSNYRPISILPILYKVFSMVLHGRLLAYLAEQQSVDQAGFRKGFNCEDHLLTLVLLHEKMYEHNLNLWLAAVDFEKAFDSVSHASLWASLGEQGVPDPYIRVLRKLYEGQTGQILSDRTSRVFRLERGTKQGDPMSPTLFNALLESIMRDLKETWGKKGFGVQLGGRRLTNLRFADDILLIGATRAQVRHMLEDLSARAGKDGLKLHMGKTKILSNVFDRRGVLAQSHVQVGAGRVEVLPFDGSVSYLGRKLCFQGFHDVEIQSRIAKGWGAFGKFKAVLCNKHYLLRSRLRLFDAVVSSTVLFGSGAWTMTAARESKLQTEMRRMLRKIIATPPVRAASVG